MARGIRGGVLEARGLMAGGGGPGRTAWASHLALVGAIVLAGLLPFPQGGGTGAGGAVPAGAFGANVRVDDTGDLLDATQANPRAFVAEDGTIYVVWGDGRAAPGTRNQDDPYLAKSVDGGRTYGRNVPVAVTANRSGGGGDLVIAEDGTIFVIWAERGKSPGVGDHIFFARSVDSGDSFSPPVVIDGHPWDESCVCAGPPRLARSGDTLFAVWIQKDGDARGRGLHLARSSDRGTTWEPPRRIDDAITDEIEIPGVAVDDAGVVYAVWADRRTLEVRLARSVNSGLFFEPSVRLNVPGWLAAEAAIAARGSDAYVAWRTIQSPSDIRGALFLSRVIGGGTTVLPPTPVLDVPTNTSLVWWLSVAVDGRGFVYVVWTDSRDDPLGWRDVYLARSIDGGRTFGRNERVNDTPVPDETAQVYPAVAANGDGSVVVWTDFRRDDSPSWGGDIFAAVPTYLPDLVPDLSWSPATPREGEPVALTATVRNVGWDLSPAATARFHEGTPPAPRIGSDQPLPPLPVNGTATVSVPWTAPASGTYDVCVVVDPDDAVPETDEANNVACRSITVVAAPMPDLAITSADLAPSPPVANGTAVLVTATVRNAGDAGSAATVVRFHDGVPPAPQIGTDRPLPPLAPGGAADVSVTWTAAPPGVHEVCVVADPDNAVPESDEANNGACVTVLVEPGPEARPDYVPEAPLPASPLRAGLAQPVSLSVQVRNVGNATAPATATLAFYDASTPGTPFATFAVPPLAPSETSSRFTAMWTSPATPGTHAVVADVDSGDELAEWNEANNRFAWTVDVVSGPVTSLVVGAPNVTAGATYVTSATPLSFSVLDQSGTGIRRTQYQIGGTGWIEYAGPFFLSGEGPHLVEWYSEDNAGNVEAVRSALLLVDDTPPTTTLAVGDPKHVVADTFVTSSTPLSLAAADGGATPVGLAVTECSIDGLPWTPCAAPFTVTGEGPHTIAFRSRDLLGNEEPPHVVTLVLDDSPPGVTIEVGTPRYAGADTYVTSATPFAVTAEDGGAVPVGLATVEYRLGGAWIPYATPFALARPDGPVTVEARATDFLGHAATERVAVTLDDTPPLTTPSHGGGTYPPGTAFAFPATDAGSGLARTEVRVNGGAWTTYDAPLVLAEGDHAIAFRSIDNLNNTEAERALSVTIEGAPTPSAESNWKPLVAVAFSALLALVGAWSARRAPWHSGVRRQLRAFALVALPFILAEGTTGLVSLLTGLLAIPPLLGAGTAVDLGILLAGIAICAYRVRKWTPPK